MNQSPSQHSSALPPPLPQPHCHLYKKYQNLSILQLKKSKLSMVHNLQQINKLLDQAITAQHNNQPQTIEQWDRQIQRNQKIKRNLQISYENYLFMMTGQYAVRVDDGIGRVGGQVKGLREEIGRFRRLLAVPMERDIRICDRLEKDLFSLEKQVQQNKTKNIKKKHTITQILQKIQDKDEQTKNLTKQIQKKLQNINFDVQLSHRTEETAQKYQDLLLRKDKLTSLLQRDEKRFNHQYKYRVKKLRELEETSLQVQEVLGEISRELEGKMLELHRVQNKNKPKITKKDRVNSSVTWQTKVPLQPNEQPTQTPNPKISKRTSRFHSETSQYNKKYPSQINRHPSQYSRRVQSSQDNTSILPKLYNVLGRTRLQIEEDCDINELIYR